MSRAITGGSTDVSTVIRFVDATTGEPETGVDHSTSGLALWYRREGGLKVAITPAALASLSTAHADGGVEPISDGYVRVDLPDAAVAAGAGGVAVGGSATGMTVIGAYHPIDEPGSYAQINQAALDASVTYDAATGSDADAIVVAITAATAPLATAAALDTVDNYLDTEIAAIKAKTDNLPASPAATGDIPSAATVAAAVWAYVAENSKTAVQILRGLWSFARGKSSGHTATGPDTVILRDDADTKDRITYTVDANGNRTAVTVNDLS